ncbi:MAG: hypothetical protein ACKOZV_07600, partial [Bacteroidota bacterium]
MIPDHEISSGHLSVSQVGRILSTRQRISISKESRERIRICRTYLDNRISNTDAVQAWLDPGSKVMVSISKKFEKGDIPDLSDEVYTATDRMQGNE